MATLAVLQKLQSRADLANTLLNQLRVQLEVVRKSSVEKYCLAEEEKLRKENETLRQEVETLKQCLIQAEINNGIKQVPMPFGKFSASVATPPSASVQNIAQKHPEAQKAVRENISAIKSEKKETATKKEAKPDKKADAKVSGTADETDKIDVSRLNMRIGKIVNVKKHPDADTLYVEEVDVGEPKPRTIVSGLVKHVPIEQMQNKVAVFVLNLKPAKMRGVLSEGMILCGSSPDNSEIVEPPEGAVVGERVTVDGYPGEPDELLNPKKKIWEQIQPDLRINNEGIATYKGVPWNLRNLGPFKVPTITNSEIK